jgi:triosephosphate isomerase
MKKLIVGNWKMQKLFSDIAPYFEVFKHKKYPSHFELGLAVPSIFIKPCLDHRANTPFMIGAQNVSEHDMGAFTGDIAAPQLASLPAAFSLVGHSERRAYHHESSDLVLKKAKKLQEAGIMAIVCIGETLEQKADYKKVLHKQLEGVFDLDPLKLVIAYEPVWAIGTGKTASLEDISQVHHFIINFLKTGGRDFSSVKVLYGGSVNQSNAASILALQDVGGLLIGGACLDPLKFETLMAQLGETL